MKYREFLEHLQKFTNQKITQTEIAEGLEIVSKCYCKKSCKK